MSAAVAAVALLFALGLPASATAQTAEFSGQSGVLFPSSDLVPDGDADGGTSLGTGVPVAVTAGVRFPGGLGLELSGVRAYDVAVEGDALLSENADFSALTGHMTYAFPAGGVTPLVGVGLGVREVDFSQFPSDAQDVVDASSDFTGVGLAGLMFAPDSWIGLRTEARVYLSSFEAFGESTGQQDFALLGGITVRVP